MCGILGVVKNTKSKKQIDANEIIINQFEEQNHRGKEGFGIVRIKDKKIEGIDRACTPMKFLMDLYSFKAESIIAHHRTPTSTENKLMQTHPMFINNPELKYDYLAIHNGMIKNDSELKEIHEALGYRYLTEYLEDKYSYTGYQYQNQVTTKTTIKKWNDSEAFAIDIARYIEHKQTEMKIVGSAAFIIIQIKKNTQEVQKIFFGRRINPLNMLLTEDYLFLSSEGEGDEIDDHKLFSIEINKTKLDKEGKFKIQERKLKFEDERLDAEKKKKEEKEKKDNPPIEQATIDKNNQTMSLITGTETKAVPETKLTKTIPKNENNDIKYFEAISDERAGYESQLQALDTEYWEKATAGIDRGTLAIADMFEEGLEARQEIIAEVLNNFRDAIMEPGYDKDLEKPRRTMALATISKILGSMENIANYENFNLAQAELDETYKDNSAIIAVTGTAEDIDYTPEALRKMTDENAYPRL